MSPTLLRIVARHPWGMRRWFRHPVDLLRILRRERQHKHYEAQTGHPYYGPVPPDSWPSPVPEGFGHVFRCVGCGQLGYDGTHVDAGGCTNCGSMAGVVVGRYGKIPQEREI